MNKNAMRLTALFLAILIAAATFAACKKSPEPQPEPVATPSVSAVPDKSLSGRYLLESVGGLPVLDYVLGILPENASFTGELPEAFTDGEGNTREIGELMTLMLNDDGTGSMENTLTGEKLVFTWTAEGGSVILTTEDGSSMSAVAGSGKIILTIKNDAGEDEDYVFAK